MEKESRSIDKINDDIRSAGQSFLGLCMADLLTRVNELEDKDLKRQLIEEYHSNQQGYYDKDIGGTRTRINAAIRIIKADKVLYALEKIDGSNPLVVAEAVTHARETISKIHAGEIELPVLKETVTIYKASIKR